MRIRQEAGIEDEVGILGGAMLEAEGFKDQNQLLLLAAQDPLTDLLAEVVDAERAGIDAQIGGRGEGGEQVGLLQNRLIQ